MLFKFPGSTDLESWARDYRLEVNAADDPPSVRGTGGHICQYADDLLAVTIINHWASSRRKLIAAGCAMVQNGDDEGTVSFDPNDAEASLAVLRSVRLR